jgi:hypothetical protein
MGFREAKAVIEGNLPPSRSPRAGRAVTPRKELAPRPEGWQEFARRVIAEAEATLWSDEGEAARAYLNARGLTDETIRAARLGLQPEEAHVAGIFPDKPVWVPRGITIPWFGDGGDGLMMVNIRRPEGSDPKYWAVRGSPGLCVGAAATASIPRHG